MRDENDEEEATLPSFLMGEPQDHESEKRSDTASDGDEEDDDDVESTSFSVPRVIRQDNLVRQSYTQQYLLYISSLFPAIKLLICIEWFLIDVL